MGSGFESYVERFELAWSREDAPDLAAFLPPEDDSLRQKVMLELIRIDLEQRWRAAALRDPTAPIGWTLHQYREALPELTEDLVRSSDLITEEYRVRKRWGDDPQPTEFLSEYEIVSKEILSELQAIDAELATEETAVAADTNDVETAILPDRQVRAPSAPSPTEYGNYELLQEIARGGMGVVYKARQRSLNRIVALKMIKDGALAGAEETRRFQVEAEAAAQLDHPNIVPIFEVGEFDGRQFFSMGFVKGNGLDASLKQGPLPPREAAALIVSISEAVQYAHDRGIIHRDLKPANVLIDDEGKPRITDFGLAKNIAVESGMTATGQVMGTPSYMPPEQAAGKTEEIGPLADVYSLGAMLYALDESPASHMP